MRVTLRYVCRICGWKWSREVSSRRAHNMDRPISVPACPGCSEE